MTEKDRMKEKLEWILNADKRNNIDLNAVKNHIPSIGEVLEIMGGSAVISAAFIGGYAIGIEIAVECLRIRGLI